MSERGTVFPIKVICVAFGICLSAAPALAQCDENQLNIRDGATVATFAIEIADDPIERSRGLMFVEDMPMFEGMLFLYDGPPQRRSFWMRNTLIPLDMLFIDSAGVVRDIHENAIPLDETSIPSATDDIAAVFEINGGLSEMLGLTVGAEVQHPWFEKNHQEVAWTCN